MAQLDEKTPQGVASTATAEEPKPKVAPTPKVGATPKAAVAPKAVAAPKAKVGSSPASDDDNDNRASARKGAIFLGAVVVAYVVYLVLSGQMGTFIEALRGVELRWVWAAALCYGLYFVFGVTAYAIAAVLDHESPVGIRDLMSVEASGVFFGNLTPMMAGAVPAQIVRLTRTGLDPGEASATQFTRFIMFQLSVVLFAAIMLVTEFGYFVETLGDMVVFNLIVFGVHFVELVGLFVICLCPGFVRRVGNWAIRLAERHHWLKDPEHWHQMVNVQVQEFSDAFRRAAKDLPSMGLTLAVTMAQLFFLYMTPWFVAKAFGIEGDFFACLAADAMLEMVTSAVPLPGGTGGAEGGFALFFGSLFGEVATAGYLVWRVVTFFGPTILAAPVMTLHSTSTVSIYHRWMRLTRREGGSASVRFGKRGGSGKRPTSNKRAGVASVDLSKLRKKK